MRKLTIVVNCTDRKSVAPADDLRVRSLPTGNMTERFAEWRRRVAVSNPSVQLRELYQGDAWSQAKALAADVANNGTEVRMLVASAGLGLRDVSLLAPSYAATFAGGHADSVTTDPRCLGVWWSHLSELPGSIGVNNLIREPILFVLSENYARAMDADLRRLARASGDYLLVGGWRDIDGLPRLPADRDLRHNLGGTVSTINLRMARRWMAKRRHDRLHTAEDARRWTRWARHARRSEQYDRATMDDKEIRLIIRELIRDQSALSATRGLRLLRDQGIACEQKRFAALFKEVVAMQ